MSEEEKSRLNKLIEGLNSKEKEQKLLSITALGILKIPEHADLLPDLLASPDFEVVKQVIIAMGRIKNPGSIKYIIEFVIADNNELAEIAWQVLQQFDLSPAIDLLIKSASSDQPDQIRLKFVSLLSTYKDIRVAALMNEILGQTRNKDLLTAAINYFICYPSSERHTALKMLSADKDWQVSLAACIALSRLKDQGAYNQVKKLAKSGNAEMRQFIVDSINNYPLIDDRSIYQMLFADKRASIREAAIKGLELFAADERVTILKNWIDREIDKIIRKQLIKKAAEEHSPIFYEEFYQNIQSTDKEIHDIAFDAIVEMGEKIVDRILIDFDRMPLVIKEQMILVLGKIASGKVISLISECLFAKERWLRINAIEAASNCNCDELYQKLVAILQHSEKDVWVRASAVMALGKSKNHDFAEIVASQIDHEDPRVRANAIEALYELAWIGLPEACQKLMHDRNDRVRVNAAIALWRSGHEEVFAELKKMALDKSRWVRSSAVFALGKINDRRGTEILLKLLSDPEEIVYRNTLEALSELGDMRAMIPILKESRKGRLSESFFNKILDKFSMAVRS